MMPMVRDNKRWHRTAANLSASEIARRCSRETYALEIPLNSIALSGGIDDSGGEP
jgi:hypothetical protein